MGHEKGEGIYFVLMKSRTSYGRIIKNYGVNPKKRLGQHFMIDPRLLQTIASIMVPDKDWVALEIGSGIGTLTKALCEKARWVYAVEIDRDLGSAVRETCKGISNLTWIWENALDLDLRGEKIAEKHGGAPLLLCGNLPYYITSQILYTVLVKRTLWKRIAFVVQEEVAQRITALPGTKSFGRISLWCQYRAKARLNKKIPRGAFLPRPEVGSCLVTLDVYSFFRLGENEEKILDEISRKAFSQRRKTILNSLLDLVPDRRYLFVLMTGNGLDPQKRPEDLTVDEYVILAKILSPILTGKIKRYGD